MNIRVSADHAGWSIREAVWGFEERVLWRGSDVTRGAMDRLTHVLEPLQRRVQTKLTWPLGDALRQRSRATRAGLTAAAVAAAVAAGAGGAMLGSTQPAAPHSAAPALPAASATPAPQGSDAVVLQGVTPQFHPGHAPPPPPPSAPSAKPSTPAAQVAWQFAQAFVAYEVGRSNDKTDATFTATATKPLVKSLAADPPRLPSHGKVPRARVLNVVLGTATKTQVTASVSLVRLRSMSELRLTLTRTGSDWRVSQVLG
jgi:hypothetical protein